MCVCGWPVEAFRADAGAICNSCREPSTLEILQFASENLLGTGVLNALCAIDDDSEEATAALDSPSKLTKARARTRPPRGSR